MPAHDGEGEHVHEPLALNETLYIETKEGKSLAFRVVGLLGESGDEVTYAVLYREPESDGEGEFIVTNLHGDLLEDRTAAEEILDDFFDAEEPE